MRERTVGGEHERVARDERRAEQRELRCRRMRCVDELRQQRTEEQDDFRIGELRRETEPERAPLASRRVECIPGAAIEQRAHAEIREVRDPQPLHRDEQGVRRDQERAQSGGGRGDERGVADEYAGIRRERAAKPAAQRARNDGDHRGTGNKRHAQRHHGERQPRMRAHRRSPSRLPETSRRVCR